MICQYYFSQFDNEIFFSIFMSFPFVIIGTKLYNNFNSITDEEFQDENINSKPNYWIQNMIEYNKARFWLQKNKEQYQTFIDSASDLIYLKDGKFRYLIINKTCKEYLNKTEDEIIGKTDFDLLTKEVAEVCRESDNKALKSENIIIEEKLIDNKIYEIRKFRVRLDVNQYGVGGYIRDLTEYKKCEYIIKEQNKFLNRMLESIPYPFYVLDANNYMIKISNTAAGNNKQENIPCYALTHRRTSPCETDNLVCTLKEVKKTKKPVKVEHIHYNKSGIARYFEVYGFPIFDDKGNVVQMIEYCVDISDRKKVENELKNSINSFESIVTKNADGIIIINTENIILYINSTAEKFIGNKNGNLVGTKLDYSCYSDKFIEIDITRNNGLKGTGEISLIETTWNRQKTYLVTIRDITERKQWEISLKESYDKLEKTLEGTVGALALEAEKRDPYTAGHQRRVTELACAIAREMGMQEEQVKGIQISGILHDVGKISVPSEILSKPGRLNELEYNMIKIHPQVGYDILKMIEFLWPIAQIVLQHQERINGSGYPQGLSGENILIEAKILAVADVVEAMSSHRPYRPALGIDKALEEIIRNKGILYDSIVVDAALRLFYEKNFKFGLSSE
ncbi:MAG: PAS domain-containing protein, partial [Candidatus Firestonebacteria bacterium]|nr:PAS domain-containing protein [Candidatus Firestonebacteria bacterium]